MEKTKTENKMGIVPVPKLLLFMGLPMIVSMLVQAFYNLVDSYFVSNMVSQSIPNIGDYAINALTLSFPIQMLIVAIGVGTGVGVNALLSKSLGEGDREKASRVAGNALFLGICTSAAFLLFGLIGVHSFLSSQTSDATVLALGSGYLTICTIFSFGSVGAMIYEKLLQGTGKTTCATAAQLTGAVLNIVLDPILIYGLFGLPALGVNGAAIATVIGQMVTLIISIFLHGVYNREIDSSMRYLKPDAATLKGIYKVGVPAIMMQALVPVMSYGINILFGLVSAAAVTAFGIYFKIQQFVFFAAFGMNNAVVPVVAYNYGRADRKRMASTIRYGILYTLFFMMLGAAGLQLFSSEVCGLFSLSDETQLLCIRAIRIVTLGYLFAGANIAFQGIFQALGFGVKSLFISLVRQIIVVLPLAYLLALLPNAAEMIWLAFPVSEAAGLVAALFFMRSTAKSLKLYEPESAGDGKPELLK